MVAVETNGTVKPPPGIDWICMSPKAGAPLVLTQGNELKLVFPQEGLLPPAVEGLSFDNYLLQPMDGPRTPWPPLPIASKIHAGGFRSRCTRS